MDHYTLTLILGSIDAIVIPWAVWATLKIFETLTKVAVLESELAQEKNMQRIQNTEIKKALDKMDGEIDDIRKEINEGFKDVLSEIRKT